MQSNLPENYVYNTRRALQNAGRRTWSRSAWFVPLHENVWYCTPGNSEHFLVEGK